MVVRDKVGRKRYVVFRLSANRRIDKGEVIGLTKHLANKYFEGQPFQPWLMELWDEKEGEEFSYVGVVKVPHTFRDEFCGILEGWREMRSGPVTFKTFKTSGSMKRAKKYANHLIQESKREAGG